MTKENVQSILIALVVSVVAGLIIEGLKRAYNNWG